LRRSRGALAKGYTAFCCGGVADAGVHHADEISGLTLVADRKTSTYLFRPGQKKNNRL